MKRGPDNGMLIVVCSLVFLGGLVLSFALVRPDLGSGSTVTAVVVARGGGRVTTPTYSVPTGSFTTTSNTGFTQTTDTSSSGPPTVTSPSTSGAGSVVTVTQPETITSVITSPGQAQTTTIVSTVTITTTKTQTTTGTTTTTTQTTQTTQTRPPDSSAAAGRVIFNTVKPQSCASCHSLGAAGSTNRTGGPDLNILKSLWAQAGRPDGSLPAFIQLSIRYPATIPGFTRHTMPAYSAASFKDHQLDELVHFIYVYTK